MDAALWPWLDVPLPSCLARLIDAASAWGRLSCSPYHTARSCTNLNRLQDCTPKVQNAASLDRLKMTGNLTPIHLEQVRKRNVRTTKGTYETS